MHEFCPDIAELRDSFLSCLKTKHEGSLVRAWKRSLDKDKSGRVSKDEFLAAMTELGWEGDAKRMYHLLDFDKSDGRIIGQLDHTDFKRLQNRQPGCNTENVREPCHLQSSPLRSA